MVRQHFAMQECEDHGLLTAIECHAIHESIGALRERLEDLRRLGHDEWIVARLTKRERDQEQADRQEERTSGVHGRSVGLIRA